MSFSFEWDETKSRNNFKKHKVNFEEAKTVFNDSMSITIADNLHSDIEKRYIDIGLSSKGRIIVVVYTEKNSIIRLISSRKGTKMERRIYEDAY